MKLPEWLAVRPRVVVLLQLVFCFSTVVLAMGAAFGLHFNLSTAGSIDLLLVVLVAFRFGLLQATAVSLTAVLALNYLFTPPVFQLTVADPQNWISLATFEITALIVSGLSTKVRSFAEQAEAQRLRSVKLYELSRAILLIDGSLPVSAQLGRLIEELIQVDSVVLSVMYAEAMPATEEPERVDARTVAERRHGTDADDLPGRSAHRVLRLGKSSIGSIAMTGWEVDPLMADAVASLAAIAIEQSRALQQENRAAAERNTEQLRSAVLDGMAHEFKTPLTAIQTASSGLLAIEQLSLTQLELVTIINDEASLLNHLCNRLLQTAALESREVRLRRSLTSMTDLLESVIRKLKMETRQRISVSALEPMREIAVDATMVELAVLQLLDNAAKYSTVGSNIRITIRQSTSETAVVVQNSGVAIRESELEKIFQRFYRGMDTTRGPAGTGLGLSIVKQIAEAHGGSATVISAEGATQFTLTLGNYRKATHA